MNDPTELPRKILVSAINGAIESDDKDAERKRLEALYGKVWDQNEIRNKEFRITDFMAPLVVIEGYKGGKFQGKRGTMMFQHSPRFYFNQKWED